jgi:hypothetical protein
VKHTSLTLLSLAALTPAAFALDVKDDDFKLGLSLQLQARAEIADAKASDGETAYSITSGASVESNDPVNFYLRRMRMGFKGSYQKDWKFGALIRIDNQDKDVVGTTTATTNRRPETHVAVIERVIHQESLKIEHSIRLGLDYAFFNGVTSVFSSSSYLLPTIRATEHSGFLAPRGTGIGYKLDAPFVTWGFDIQNNVNDDTESGATHGGDGLCYTTRVQITPDGELAIKKPVESFIGKPGKGIMLSAEYGKNTNYRAAAASPQDLTAYGVELLGHLDGLTVLAEWRAAKLTDVESSGADETRSRNIMLIQAGYAFPLGDDVIEPAFRFSKLDLDKDDVGETDTNITYGTADYGNSGRQIELGVNYYFRGTTTAKFQLGYQNWKAEQGDAKASIYRAQMQLSF